MVGCGRQATLSIHIPARAVSLLFQRIAWPLSRRGRFCSGDSMSGKNPLLEVSKTLAGCSSGLLGCGCLLMLVCGSLAVVLGLLLVLGEAG